MTDLNTHPKRSGFTIVELLVVIVVIGILAAITVVSYAGISQKATAASLQSDLKGASTKLKMYMVDYGSYPTAMSGPSADGTMCPSAPVVDNTYCIKPSPGNSYASIAYSNPTSQSFILTAVGGSSTYHITENSKPIVGVFVITYTLTVNASSNGTVNIAINGSYSSGSTPTITATPSGGYSFSSWSGSAGCNGTTTASYAITMNDNKSCTANFVIDPWADWYSGIAATALAGKHVYKTDLDSDQLKTTNDSIVSPQGTTGLDPNYPSNKSLVSPQTNPGVDFSTYPAQNACKSIGGRLPNMQELFAIYTGRASYGNNFIAFTYWSSTESTSSYEYSVNFNDGSIYSFYKTAGGYIRCVSG